MEDFSHRSNKIRNQDGSDKFCDFSFFLGRFPNDKKAVYVPISSIIILYIASTYFLTEISFHKNSGFAFVNHILFRHRFRNQSYFFQSHADTGSDTADVFDQRQMHAEIS